MTNASDFSMIVGQLRSFFPSIHAMYHAHQVPHPRLLAKLKLRKAEGEPVPKLSLEDMWKDDDNIKTKRLTFDTGGSDTHIQSMSGTDECLDKILILDIEHFKKRMVTFWMALFIVGYLHKEDVDNHLFTYLMTMETVSYTHLTLPTTPYV